VGEKGESVSSIGIMEDCLNIGGLFNFELNQNEFNGVPLLKRKISYVMIKRKIVHKNLQNFILSTDNRFHTVAALSEGTQYLEESVVFLAFPSGVVRGALANLGISALVTAQVEKLPIVKFNIHLNK